MKPQNIVYYLKWVSDCYHFLNEPLSARLNSDQKKQFLSDMAKRYEDWQVKQADTALRLYDYLLSIHISPITGEVCSHRESWQLLEKNA